MAVGPRLTRRRSLAHPARSEARCRFIERGWEDGLDAAAAAGYTEGYALGVDKGDELGRELGFYYGAALVWQQRMTAEAATSR